MSKPLDGFFLERFRSKLAEELGVSNGEFLQGYDGLWIHHIPTWQWSVVTI